MRIVIVGGVAGGASAAARARRLDETAEIILLQSGPDVSFGKFWFCLDCLFCHVLSTHLLDSCVYMSHISHISLSSLCVQFIIYIYIICT